MKITLLSSLTVNRNQTGRAASRVPAPSWAALLGLLLFLWPGLHAGAATWYLQAFQPSWDTLSNWYSEPFGGGTHPGSISAEDEFDLNGYTLRSMVPAGQTFGGKTLIFNGGAAGMLELRTVAPGVCVIPNMISNGGTIRTFVSGTDPAISAVQIGKLSNHSNTTFSTGLSTRGLEVEIGSLTGKGDLTMMGLGGGEVSLKIKSATEYHGTLYIADGCHLTFQSPVTSSGALNIDSTTQVAVTNDVSFAGLTVSGTIKPPGVYSAASLAFSGTGRVTVKPSSLPAKVAKVRTDVGKQAEHAFGVNFPGGSFGTAKYPVDPVEWEFYHSKGLNLIRVAFQWERVQPKLNGDLDPTTLEGLDAAVAIASANGMKVMLDMHNYDRYPIITGTGKTEYLIGSPEVPYEAFKDVWKKLAAHFVNQKAIYGYDIMNEPHATKGTWPEAAQAGVDGVRQSDTAHFVIVEGDSWASATRWIKENGNFEVKDPTGLVIYSAHTYWDNDYSGKYGGTYDSNHVYPNIGLDRAAPFVHWLKLKKARGFIGEYGIPTHVPSPDQRWYAVLDNFLSYLDENDVGGTYWAAGNCWSPGYTLQVGRVPGQAEQAPITAILQKYR